MWKYLLKRFKPVHDLWIRNDSSALSKKALDTHAKIPVLEHVLGRIICQSEKLETGEMPLIVM
jgi:hypothetical protein